MNILLFPQLKNIFLTSIFGMLVFGASPQNTKLKGIVKDGTSGTPIRYATVIIEPRSDSTKIYGDITSENGLFQISDLPYGDYELKISFVGYYIYHVEKMELTDPEIDLGQIDLKVDQKTLDEITVKSKNSGVKYEVDRKIIEARNFPGADKAIDLMENIPSLELDVDGRLTYRGDGTFLVYINGRPELNGEEKLRQIPANKIQYIEVITNPSSKYDAEGTAGIIQVILKRNRLEGIEVSTSLNLSTLGSSEFIFSVDKKGERGGWYLNGQVDDYVSRIQWQQGDQTVTNDNIRYKTLWDVKSKNRENNSYMELGFNYDLSDKDYLDFKLSADPIRRSSTSNEKGKYSESLLLDNKQVNYEEYTLDSRYHLYYRYLSVVASYEHAFNKDRSNLLSAYISSSSYLQPLEEQKCDELIYSDHSEKFGYQSKEHNELLVDANVTYENKLSDKSRLEAGMEVNLDHIPKVETESGTFNRYNVLSVFVNEKENEEIDFEQDVYAGFITFKSSFGKLDYQVGVRGEFTHRQSNYSYNLVGNGELANIPATTEFWNWFPTAHFVYNISDENQFTLNYSRRISRPDYWELIPLRRYETQYISFTGNENLMPSYVNAYELGYLKSWDENFVSGEVFARQTNNLSRNYYRTGEGNSIEWTKENVGESLSVGVDFMLGYQLFDWWNTNLSTSTYFYKLNTTIDDKSDTQEIFRGSIRSNNNFRISKTLSLRYQLVYQSRGINAQMERDGYAYSNLVLRKSFFNRRLTTEVSWANIFNSIKYQTRTTGDNLYVETDFERKPYASFKISYVFVKRK
ncbi:outer membrane beta-barrel family protein [uncultured Draconibacterium sp.]|uniref:outer membrane beta-barrel family protein n=1 Tax=uncultured Draconibacterium sp. TaxID=1573823 RepID=UPI0029C6183B|nr:outer membrane beta-barrel family protein [uncultured Draconibacterium sp.]